MTYKKLGVGVDQQIIAWSQGIRDRYFFRFISLLAKIGVRPAMLTLLGFLMMVLSAYFFATDKLVSFWFFFGGLFMDALDGPLARNLKVDDYWGEFLDAATDTLGFSLLVIAMIFSGFLETVWAWIYVANYVVMQFLIFYFLLKGRKIAVPWRSRFFVFLVYLLWLTTGISIFDSTMLVFGIYMITENLRLLMTYLWK